MKIMKSFSLFKKKYYAVILIRDTDNTYSVRDVKKISATDNQIRLKSKNGTKKTFLIDLQYPTFQNGRKQFYFIEYNHGVMLLNEQRPNGIPSPEVLDDMLNESALKQLAKESKALDINWTMVLGILGSGVAMGYILKEIMLMVM